MEYWLDAAWQLLLREVRNWILAILRLDLVDTAEAWDNIKLYIQAIAFLITSEIGVVAGNIADDVQDYADGIVEALEDWASTAITNIETAVTTLINGIINVWDSIVAIWGRFGAELLDTSLTVVEWIEAQVTAAIEGVEGITAEILNWIIEAWDWVSVKGTEVWTWITTKAESVWSWITGIGASVESWYDEQYDWLSDLFMNKREELADFLDDPGGYIADWVVDSLEYIVAECVFRFW